VTLTTPHPLPRPAYVAQITGLQRRLQEAEQKLQEQQTFSRQLAIANATIRALREQGMQLSTYLRQTQQQLAQARRK
jgi:hypothetical protein